MELLFPSEHPVAGWRPLLIYINYSSPQGWLQIQSCWANAHINKNLGVWFMAISSAVEVYTILQRHLDTLLIISIMYLKHQSVDSRLKISLIKAINLSELLLIGLEKKEFPHSREETKLRMLAFWWKGPSCVSQVHQAQKFPEILVFVWLPAFAVHRWFSLPHGMIFCRLNNNNLVSSW